MSYTICDVETTIRSSYKRKANPFDPLNWVVYVGVMHGGKSSEVTRYLHPDANIGWLANILASGTRMIVGHNIKFDILHAIAKDQKNLEAWMDFVAGGGQVWDTQLAEYLLGGMLPELHMLALDEVAPKYGGVLKIDEVKALWEAGIDTPDIPEDLLTRYLHGDLSNTEKVFLGQLKRARECGQVKSLLLNFGSLLYTIEAERNGMAVDKEKGLALAAELEVELAELTAKLQAYLPADLPFEFSWSSPVQKSALIFGGQVKYQARLPINHPDGPLEYKMRDEVQYLKADGTTTHDPLDPGVVFYASGKNQGQAKTKKVKVPDLEAGPKTKLFDVYYQFPGFTEPKPEWQGAKEGVYSTAAAVIEELGARDIPFLKDLSRRAAVEKDLGTYFIRTDEKGVQSGMLTLVQPDGVIHHSLNHTSTVTGRFSSSNPNLQNIPKGNKSKVKQVFISRFHGGKVIQSDFTSLEIYIQAILTGDKQLIADLKAGLDMHVARVSTTFKLPYEEAFRLCKSTNPDGTIMYPEWDMKRTKAKVFSFQRAYGAGAEKIAATTGMTVDEVYDLINAENLRYPEVEPYYERLTAAIEASKRNVRKVIPHPDFPAKQVELRTGYHRTPDNKLYAWIEQPAPKFVVQRKGVFTGFSPTEIKNYEVQGGGGEWAKAGMWLAVRAFYSYRNFGHKALLVNQVHDACYADADGSVAFEAAALLHACMESASDFMETYFAWPQPVHVPSDTTWGATMADEGKIEGVEERAKFYREVIRKYY